MPGERPRRRAVGSVVAALALGVWLGSRFGATYVGGWSMSPALIPGDLVVYSRGCEGAGEGDPVLFEHAGWPGGIVHRVVYRRWDGAFVTRGDANETIDSEPVAARDVSGVAMASVPSGRAVRAVVAGMRWCYNRSPIAHKRR